MGRATTARNGGPLWRYVPRLPRSAFFYAGVYVTCTAIWLVLWLTNSREEVHLALAAVFAVLGLAHVTVECVRARHRDRGKIVLDK